MKPVLTERPDAATDTAPALLVGVRPAPPYLRRSGPWRRAESLVLGVIALLGTAGVVVSWYGAGGEVRWRDQFGWITGGALCASFVVLAAAVWIALGLRRVRSAVRELAAARRAVLDLDRPAVDISITALLAASPHLVTAESMARAHRADCLLMRGKRAIEVPAAEVERWERCGVCGGDV